MTKIDNLPKEILSLICSLLKQSAKYNCILVNREFYTASILELWREPILPTIPSVKLFIKCMSVSKHQKGKYIRDIKLDKEVSMTDEDLLLLLQLVPNLEILELRKGDQLTDKSIQKVSLRCQKLKSFSIKGAPITYRSAHYLGQCKQLQRLTLASCPNLSSLALLPFAELKIEYLDLSGCKWLNVLDTAHDLQSFHNLTNLTLVCCDAITIDFIDHLTDESCLKNLQDFSITGGTVIDDRALVPFIKTHTSIRGLSLLECAITSQTLEAISLYLPDLYNLDLSYCRGLSSQDVRNLIINCHNLKLLGLKDCEIAQSEFPGIPSSLYPANNDYTYLDKLSYIELAHIRSQMQKSEEGEQERSKVSTMSIESNQEANETDIEMEEAGTDSSSINENYTYIQQYLINSDTVI